MLYKKKSRKFVLKKEYNHTFHLPSLILFSYRVKGHPTSSVNAAKRKADDSTIEAHFRRPESQDKPQGIPIVISNGALICII